MYNDYKVLVVEDRKDIAKWLERDIKKLGVHVDTASEKADALKKIRQTEYDIVVMDLNLPPVEKRYDEAVGFDLLKEIEKLYLDTYCIIHSVYQNTAPVSEKVDEVCQARYVQKSGVKGKDSISKICDIIRKRINRLEESHKEQGIVKIKDVEYDVASGLIKYENKTAQLTPGQRRMIAHLLKNRGKSCTYIELRTASTGQTPCFEMMADEKKIVIKEMQKIRKKFKDLTNCDDYKAYIAGIRDVGYRIDKEV